MNRFLKSGALTLTVLILMAGSLRADSYTFIGTAGTGNDNNFFFLSGPSFNLYSAAPAGSAAPLGACTAGSICQFPSQTIGTWESPPSEPGEFSGGTINGIVAHTLSGGIIFSGSSFVLGSDPKNLGSGPVSFTGDIVGALFTPAGCETLPGSPPCTPTKVFHLRLKGTGTVTALGEPAGDNGLFNIVFASYNLRGTATIVPEPSTVWLLMGGLPGIAAFRYWRSRRSEQK